MKNSLHTKVYNFLEDFREAHPGFTYCLRQRNTKNRLSEGLWFQGNDGYAFVGLYDRSGGANMTRSVGLVFRERKADRFTVHLEIVYKDEQDKDVIEFYQRSMDSIGGFQQIGEKKFEKHLVKEGSLEAVEAFLTQEKPQLDQLLHSMGLERLLVSEERFKVTLDRVRKIQVQLSRPRDLLVFQDVLRRHGAEYSSEFFRMLDLLLEELKINQSHDLLVFSCTSRKRLTFSIGPRYVLVLYREGTEGTQWGFISLKEIKDKGVKTELFNGQPTAHYNTTSSLSLPRKFLKDIKEACWAELARGATPHHKKHNNPCFEQAAFDKAYRDDILQKTFGSIMQVNVTPLNQILYGPPGTGKTYATKAQAVAILDGTLPDTRAAINQRYQELVQAKRIIFVTFHQSSTYEDFVEGIKPVMGADEDDGELQYKIEDGVFKRMCVEATYEFVKRQNKEQAAGKTLDFSQRLDQLLNQFQQQLDDGEQIEIPLKSGQQIRVEEISKQGNFILRHVDGDRTYTVSQTRLEKLFNEIEDFDQIPNIYAYFRSIIGGSNASAYWAILNQLYQQEASSPVDTETSSSAVDYTIKQQAFYRMNWQARPEQEVVPKYLMIIDEINRGNVAAIFGELITLLEEDKRGGQEEYLSVVLPYSKERLVVPPNLYLIGTMNTADRSVEALDTALRRRFAFQEVAPNSKLLSPRAMIQANWNRYVNSDWDEKDFRSHCNRLYDFLGLPEKDRNSLEKASKAEKGVEITLSQLSYLDQVTLSGVNLEKILFTINHRIELLLDKDHCIGHAYFMGVATADDPWQALRKVFAQKVIPLLEEYFFGATGKIQLVLGPAFCTKSEANQEDNPFATGAKFGSGEYDQREIYRTVDIVAMGEEKFREVIQSITA